MIEINHNKNNNCFDSNLKNVQNDKEKELNNKETKIYFSWGKIFLKSMKIIILVNQNQLKGSQKMNQLMQLTIIYFLMVLNIIKLINIIKK